MKLELAKAYVQLIPSFKGAEKVIAEELGGKPDTQKKLGSRIGGNIVSGLKTAFKTGMASVAAIGATALYKGFNRLKDIENAEASLRGLGMASAEVEKVMGNAMTAVKGTAFGMNEAAGAASQLSVAGVSAGKDMERHLRLVTDLAAQTNSGMGEMGSIYGKVAAQGKLSGEVAQQLLDRNINAYALVAEHLGITTDAAVEMGRKGEISFDLFADAMESKVGGAALEMGNTTEGAWKNMNAALSRFGVALLDKIYPHIGPAMKKITEWVDTATDRVGEFVDGFMGGISAFTDSWKSFDGEVTSSGFQGFMQRAAFIVRGLWERLKELGQWLWDHKDEIAGWVASAAAAFASFKLGSVIAGWVTNLRTLWVTFSAGKGVIAMLSGALKGLISHPIVLVFAAITGAVVLMWTKFDWFREAVKNIWAAVSGFISGAWENTIKPAFEALWGWVTNILVPALQDFWQNTVKPVFQRVGDFIRDTWANTIQPALKQLVDWFNGTLKPQIMDLWERIIKPVFTLAGNIIRDTWNNVIKPALSGLWVFIRDTLIPVIQGLWNNVVQPLFGFIGDKISTVWSNIISPALSAFKNFVADTLMPALNDLYYKVIKPVMGWIGDVIGAAWRNVIKPIFTSLRDFVVKDLGGVFNGLLDTITWVFNGIANVLRVPINFVIDTVYNNGIRKAVNWVFDALGSDIELPKGPTVPSFGGVSAPKRFVGSGGGGRGSQISAYAKGGRAKPGWALVGEEGPELVNFEEPGRVYTATQTAQAISKLGSQISPGLIPDRRYTSAQASFALTALRSGDESLLAAAQGSNAAEALLPIGGIFSWLGKKASGLYNGVKDFVAGGIRWVRGKLADGLGAILNPLVGKLREKTSGKGAFLQMAGESVKYVIDSALEWVRGVDEEDKRTGKAISEVMPNVVGGISAAGMSGGTRHPLGGKGWLSGRFGTPRYGSKHAGIDLAAPQGTPIYAYAPGTVTMAGWNILGGRTGIGALMKHAWGYTYYGHMSRAIAKAGMQLGAGGPIGLVGSTGNSTGPHLHFEMHQGGLNRVVDPYPYLFGAKNTTKMKASIYDQGGWLPPGVSVLENRTGKPEPVLNPNQWELMSKQRGDTYNVYLTVPVEDLDEIAAVRRFADRIKTEAQMKAGI